MKKIIFKNLDPIKTIKKLKQPILLSKHLKNLVESRGKKYRRLKQENDIKKRMRKTKQN
jgi:DNA polymerase elongation subunit (family B)